MSKSRAFVANLGLILAIVVGYALVDSGPAWSQPLAAATVQEPAPPADQQYTGAKQCDCLPFRSVYEMEDDQTCEVVRFAPGPIPGGCQVFTVSYDRFWASDRLQDRRGIA